MSTINDIRTKAKTILRHIYSTSENLEEARSLIALMSTDEDFLLSEWKKLSGQHQRFCVNCGRSYVVGRSNAPEEGFCPSCDTALHQKELRRVQAERRRAIRAGKAATLTFREWMVTYNYFNGYCAYCKYFPITVMEHFIPLRACPSHIGTTKNNTVPACSSCNFKKSGRNPNNARSLKKIRIKAANLDRVRAYLQSMG